MCFKDKKYLIPTLGAKWRQGNDLFHTPVIINKLNVSSYNIPLEYDLFCLVGVKYKLRFVIYPTFALKYMYMHLFIINEFLHKCVHVYCIIRVYQNFMQRTMI